MSRYEVCIPFAGYFTGEVQADTPKEAIEKAIEEVGYRVVMDTTSDFEVAEVETLHSVSAGNVNYAPLCKASADEIKE
jgi:hypothetical protein